MLGELHGMPAGVIGFEVSGTVRAEDYRNEDLSAGAT
jgi:hypothetical protein